jgi:DNA repair protein RadC
MGIIGNLFGDDEIEEKKTVRLRCLRSIFEWQVVRENAPVYLVTTRFTSSAMIFEVFRDMAKEPKEHFITLHLDGKNRVICFDRVAVGSLNQCIV